MERADPNGGTVMIIRTALLLATLAFAGLAEGSLAIELGSTSTVSPPSAPSPALPPADDVAGQDGTNYPGSEIEPSSRPIPRAGTP